MFRSIIAIFILTFFLTGCVKQSAFVNVNLPAEKVVQPINSRTVNNTNINNNISGNVNNNNIISSNSNTAVATPTRVEIPAKLELKVAFAPQAPFGNWNELHEEACEEASMIIAAKYFLNQPLDEKIMETEISQLDIWEKDNSYKIDLSASQTADVLKKYFNLEAKVVDEVSVDRIKYELSLGHLVIVPASGRELNNPYFRTPGPIYHMLVIKGYNSSEFIVNEVGTKRGNSFKYKYQQLINAIHDWDPNWSHYEVTDEQINSQPKRMVVVSK